MDMKTIPASVTVSDHPVVKHQLSLMRDKKTSTELFRQALRRVALFVFGDAIRDLPMTESVIETPLCKTHAWQISPQYPILISPILRAGLSMADVALDLLPDASVYHIGLYRNEETLEPVTYYNKLPSTLDYGRALVFVLDPMLATGGSGVAAVDMIKKLGVKIENLRFVSIISAPEGIENLTSHHPGIKIYTGAVDEHLNDKGYIVPGLGDAGDRTFGTV